MSEGFDSYEDNYYEQDVTQKQELRADVWDLIHEGKIDEALTLAKEYNFLDEDIEEIAENAFISYFVSKKIDIAEQIAQKFNISENSRQYLIKKYIHEAANGFGYLIVKDEDRQRVRDKIYGLPLPKEEIDALIKNEMRTAISGHLFYYVFALQDTFGVFSREEIKEVIFEEFHNIANDVIKDNLINYIERIKEEYIEKYSISIEEIQGIALRYLVNKFSDLYSREDIDIISQIKDILSIDDGVLEKREFQEIIQPVFKKILVIQNSKEFSEFSKEFPVTDEIYVSVVKEILDGVSTEDDNDESHQPSNTRFFSNGLDRIPQRIIAKLESTHFLETYISYGGYASATIYSKYLELQKLGNPSKVNEFFDSLDEFKQKLISSEKQDNSVIEHPFYRDVVESVYPNHSQGWTSFASNESCTDRTGDLAQYKIQEKYVIDLAEGVEMVLKTGQDKDDKSIKSVETPIADIQKRFMAVGFEKSEMQKILDEDLDGRLANYPNKSILNTREDKIYALLLESLVDNINSDDLKEIVIAYQFAEFEDIQNYINGTRARAEQSKNPDYAYLLELREFYADRLKEIERKIVSDASKNEALTKLLPDYYQAKIKIDKEKLLRSTLDKARVDTLGLEGKLLQNISRTLERNKDKKGNLLTLVENDTEGNLVLGQRGKAIYGMITAEQNKVASLIREITGDIVEPDSINLEEFTIEDYIKLRKEMSTGEYNEGIFAHYLSSAFKGIYSEEVRIIDREIRKYHPKEENLRDKKQKKLECIITKNHTSAHARAVGGVCVSGDNPKKSIDFDYDEDFGSKQQGLNMWNMNNFFQMVLRDADTKICQGLVMLHMHEDHGKKVLTASMNPSSTYLYKVNEKQLFEGLVKQLSIFAQDNNVDIIAVSNNEQIRTNRTGGEFERAMNSSIIGKYKLDQLQYFSYHPRYLQRDLSIIWEK